MKRGREKSVLKACQDWLEINEIFYVRHNPISPVRPGQWRKVRESQKGGPDLIIFIRLPGHIPTCMPIAIECKSSTGKLSQAQIDWWNRAEANGLRYFVVREITDLEEVLEEISVGDILWREENLKV